MKKVLIVDDSLLAEFAIKSYFTKLNYEVIGLAKNGKIALDMIDKLNPDIITVDKIMPGISGVELIQEINERDQKLGKKTVIFMISSDDIPAEERAKIDVAEYIIKPITMGKIKLALKNI